MTRPHARTELRAEILRSLGELYDDPHTRSQFKRFEFVGADAGTARAILQELARHLLVEYRPPDVARLTAIGERLLRDEIDATDAEPPPPAPPTPEEQDALSRAVGGAEYFSQSRVIDGRVVIQWATPGLARITGFTPEELDRIGGWPSVLRDPARAAPMFERLSRGEMVVGELEVITRGRQLRTIRFAILPRMHGNRLIGTATAGKDVTPA